MVESDTANIYATTSDTSQCNRGVDTQGAIVNVDNSFSNGTPLRSLTVPRTRKKHLDEAVLEPKQPEDTRSPDSLKKPRRRLHLESDDSDETSQLDMDTDKPEDKSPILYTQCTTKVIKIEKDKDAILPDPFPLPKYVTPQVEVAVNSGEVDRFARNNLLHSIIHSVVQYKKYLNDGDYINLSGQIMKEYPSFFSSQVKLIVLFYNIASTTVYILSAMVYITTNSNNHAL